MNKIIKMFEKEKWDGLEYRVYRDNSFEITYFYNDENIVNIYYSDINYNSSTKMLNLYGKYYRLYGTISKTNQDEFLRYIEKEFGVIINETNIDINCTNKIYKTNIIFT